MNRKTSIARIERVLTLAIAIFFAGLLASQAQTTAFTYQGRLNDGATAANGTYALGFALYDAATGGTQIGNVVTLSPVSVSNGVFTVQLDFGANAFPGANRYLQIAVRKAGEQDFTTLTPRQPLTSAPYAIQSLNAVNATTATNAANAQQLGGTAASNFVQMNSTAFIRNQTTQQPSSNFNISGNGVVGGKVGIGTTSAPTTASPTLQVNGGILARGGVPGASGTSNNGYAFSGGSGDNDSGMFSTADGTLQFYTDNAERIRLTRGIDLTAGNGSDSDSFFDPGGAGAEITLQAGNGGNGFYFGGAGAGVTLRAGNGGNGGNSSNGGNGDGGAGAGVTLQAGNGGNGGGDSGNGGNGASITLQPGGGGNGTRTTGTSGNVILAPTNGNVGIGTTTPTSKLYVNGNLTVTGTISGNINGANLTNLNASNIASGTLDTARLGVIPIANGGTGSATQNFVDLTTAQTIGGSKTFSNTVTGSIFNAATEFRIGGNRVLSIGGSGSNNMFVGAGAGNANTSGLFNAFVGNNAGFSNTTGFSNSFLGNGAGYSNTTGSRNAFFGETAGSSNITGDNNSFFGEGAGRYSTTGGSNTFVGTNAGSVNSTGGSNAFVGNRAGVSNTTGSGNAFVGDNTGNASTTGSNNAFFGTTVGQTNTTGSNNTLLGSSTNVGTNNLTYATAVGAGAIVSSNNTIVLGRTADEVKIPGSLNVTSGIVTNKFRARGGAPGADGIFNNGFAFESNDGDNDSGLFSTANGRVSLYTNSNERVRVTDTGLEVFGTLSATTKNFKIDHPLDPLNKTLTYTSVESPDMKNIYDGNITTDANGEAIVRMPDYFEALNRDFRYQLTVIGTFAQAIVAEKIKGNLFLIKTDQPNVEVSWQVTGVRRDKFAEDNRPAIEETKSADTKGKCLYAPACTVEPKR